MGIREVYNMRSEPHRFRFMWCMTQSPSPLIQGVWADKVSPESPLQKHRNVELVKERCFVWLPPPLFSLPFYVINFGKDQRGSTKKVSMIRAISTKIS